MRSRCRFCDEGLGYYLHDLCCVVAMPESGEPETVRAEVAGAVTGATTGRLVNVRRCGNGMAGRGPEVLGGSIGLTMRVDSLPGG